MISIIQFQLYYSVYLLLKKKLYLIYIVFFLIIYITMFILTKIISKLYMLKI